MRIFIIEYITGGGLVGEDIPPSLAHEGDLMLTSLATDLCAVEGVSVTISRDPRLPWAGPQDRLATPPSGAPEDIWAFWERCLEKTDALWPIAPETGGALERLSRLCLAKGRILLGSDPDTISILASKSQTLAHLGKAGIGALPAFRAGDDIPLCPDGYVAKPDDGAGAVETFYFADRKDLARWLNSLENPQDFILQPYHPGTPASLSALFSYGQARLLSCNRQNGAFTERGFEYSGFEVGGMEEMRPAFSRLAQQVAAAFPGLWGYAGVDVIVEGDTLVALEINPRLTTSYAGLARATGENPARAVLSLLDSSHTFSKNDHGILSPVVVGAPPQEASHV